MRKILLILLVSIYTCTYSQEICNDGIDNNGNGLVDMNDPECYCAGFSLNTNIPSLIPNHSFELMNCCPSGFSQMNCANGWIQATTATSDFFHTCNYVPGAAINAGLVPFPDGNGILGSIFYETWKEYVGSCLTAPLIAGNTYVLTFYIASTPATGQLNTCNNGNIYYSPVDITIYGNTDCAQMPIATTNCPSVANPTWIILSTATYTPTSQWEEITFTFTPTVNINAVIFGPPCTLPADYSAVVGCYPYFYYDRLILNEISFFSGLNIVQSGNYCSNNLVLTAQIDTNGGTWQWYLDGVALIGETNATLNISANGYGSGLYTASYSLLNMCESADYYVDIPIIPIANAGLDTVLCGFGSVLLQGSGGGAYQWAPAGSLSNAQIATPIATPLTTTTYTLTVSDANGCMSTDEVIIYVLQPPLISAGGNQSICDGQNFQLTATGGTTYEWFSSSQVGPILGNVLIVPNTTTTYTVIGTDDNGCTGTDSMVLSVLSSPSASAGNDQIICLGQSANLTASGGVSYAWSNGALMQNINVMPNVTTTYTVTVTNNLGCTEVDEVVVFVNTPPNVNAGQNASICSGQSVQLQASGGIGYAWAPTNSLSNAQIFNPVATPNVTTTYSVTVTDNFGCTASSYVVIQTIVVLANAGQNASICLGDNVQLNASGGSNYVWAPANTLSSSTIANPIANPTVTTTYTVTVTDIMGCTSSDKITVSVLSLPIASISTSHQTVCQGQTVTLALIGSSTYTWSNGVQNQSININPLQTTTYGVTVYDSNNCQASDQITIFVNALPPADAGNNQIICAGNSVQLQASGGVFYQWAPHPSLNNYNISNPIATPNTSMTYTVTVTDAIGCSQTDNVVVMVYAIPNINLGNFDVCMGASAIISATGGSTYLWSTGQTTPTIVVAPQITTTYTVTATNLYSCSAQASAVVTVNPIPIVSAGQDTVICEGDAILLNANGGTSYEWSNEYGLSSYDIYNPLAFPNTTTTYTVTVTDVNGCSNTDNVVVGVFPNPIVHFTAMPLSGCAPLEIQFTDFTSPVSQNWLWNFGDPNSNDNTSNLSNPTHTYQLPGTYSVTLNVFTSNDCMKTLTFNEYITVYPNPIADFYFTPETTTPGSPINFIDLSLNAVSWIWNFGEPISGPHNISLIQSPRHTYQNEGRYIVSLKVKSMHGCIDSTQSEIIIQPELSFYVPNVFTPNGDGINDYFQAYGTNMDDFSMYIFNRWGDLIFESTDINTPWDGKPKDSDKIVPQGVYIYKISFKDLQGRDFMHIGHVTLVNQ